MADFINEKFDETMARAADLVTRLVGADGDGGYLGILNSLIGADTEIGINELQLHHF